MKKSLQINSLKDGMDKVLGLKEVKDFIVKVFIGILLMSVSTLSFAGAKYLAYDSSVNPAFPYVYGRDLHNRVNRYTKDHMQGKLMLMDDVEEFKRVFNFFEPHGLDINWVSEVLYDHSYLTKATAKKSWSLVPYLIERGINLDHQDYYEATGLIYAAVCGHLPTVGRLVLAGADTFLKDGDGDNSHWGVGTNEEISSAELEALEMCEVKSGGMPCSIDFSECQGE